MLNELVQQFAGGGAGQMEGNSLFGGVAQMMEQAPNEHGVGAVSEALGALGASGFGQSVQQGASHGTPQQRNGLADLLLNAVSHGGGSPQNALSQLGIGGSSLNPNELGTLAGYVAENHPQALAGVLGNHIGNGGGGGVMSLLGNPMVQQMGMKLAQRLL